MAAARYPVCWKAVWPLVLLCGASAPGSSESVIDRLNATEQRLEKAWADYWRQDYREAQGQAASTEAAQAAIRSVLRDALLAQALRNTRFSDPVLERRRELFLDAALWRRITDHPDLAKVRGRDFPAGREGPLPVG